MIAAGILALLLQAPVAADEAEPPAAAEEPRANASPADGAGHPDYPLGPGSTSDFWAPGDPLRLTDLRFGLVDDQGTTQAFGARVRAGRLGLVGVEFDGERRAVSLLARRTELRFATTDGRIEAAASVRLSRLILSADLEENDEGGEQSYVFRPGIALRITPGLELLGGLETDSRKVDGGTLQASSGGVLFQHGAAFEATGLYRHEKVATGAPDSDRTDAVNTVDTVSLAAVGQFGRLAELSANGFVRDTDGRFPRTEMGGRIGTRVALAPRLRADGVAFAFCQDGAGQLAHDVRGSLTWFARRQTLPRSGDAARHSATLARKATRLGLNERRSDTDTSRREQRMRLSLNGRAEDLRDEARAVYEAEVRERDVPVLGAEYVDTSDSVAGGSTTAIRAFIAIPWPPSLPWRENPSAVPFLRLDVSRERLTTSVSDEAITWRVGMTASLSREIDGVVRWSRVNPSALDAIQGVGQHDVLEIFGTYALGR